MKIPPILTALSLITLATSEEVPAAEENAYRGLAQVSGFGTEGPELAVY